MFGIGWQELIIIAIVALLIVGPKKLPDLAKTLGKGFKEFQKRHGGNHRKSERNPERRRKT